MERRSLCPCYAFLKDKIIPLSYLGYFIRDSHTRKCLKPKIVVHLVATLVQWWMKCALVVAFTYLNVTKELSAIFLTLNIADTFHYDCKTRKRCNMFTQNISSSHTFLLPNQINCTWYNVRFIVSFNEKY